METCRGCRSGRASAKLLHDQSPRRISTGCKVRRNHIRKNCLASLNSFRDAALDLYFPLADKHIFGLEKMLYSCYSFIIFKFDLFRSKLQDLEIKLTKQPNMKTIL